MPNPLTPTDRYISPGTEKTYWIPEIADINDPQRAEIEAGTDLSAEIASKTGWEVRADRVPVPDEGSKFTGRITGRVNPGDAQITFYASRDTQDIRTLLHRGDKGYIFIADGGDVPGQIARVFAVEVAAVTPTTNSEGSEAKRIIVDFAITDVAEEVIIPELS
ncbi:MAG: hypothetical protein DIU75_016380 [Mycolicibacterium hassiacum]